MSYQVWGTYSVRDHLRTDAFVADVILYDRLVVPVLWLQRFIRDGATDQASVVEAVVQVRDLEADWQRTVHVKRLHAGAQFAVVFANLGLAAMSGPLGPLFLGGAFLSIGQFVMGQLHVGPKPAPSPAAPPT